jgi:hypothetical protein
MFAAIIGLIIYLYMRRRRIEKGVEAFYPAHGLMYERNPSPTVRATLTGANLVFCYRGTLRLSDGSKDVPFHWWVWYVKNMTTGHGGTQHQYLDFRVTVALDGAQLSVEFLRTAAEQVAKRQAFFWYNPRKLDSVVTMSDGTVLLQWRVRYENPEFYEHIYNWLSRNVRLKPKPREADFLSVHDFASYWTALSSEDRYHLGWLLQFALGTEYHAPDGIRDLHLAQCELKSIRLDARRLAHDGFRVAAIEKSSSLQEENAFDLRGPGGIHLQYLPAHKLFLDRRNRKAFQRAGNAA